MFVKAVQREERELLYADFIKEKDKREREAKKAERRRRTAAFRALLEKSTFIKVRLRFFLFAALEINLRAFLCGMAVWGTSMHMCAWFALAANCMLATLSLLLALGSMLNGDS